MLAVEPANKRRMSDLQQQLADLRARVARVAKQCDAKYDAGFASKISLQDSTAQQPEEESHSQAAVENWLGGEVIETAQGRHF